ncbi:MAG: prolyl oligopeptidase family serine peptidase [Candidatus Aminicenantes bacterium]|nr:prolyl oligopeptidase family serine peptidase [Candidatus Aminicenantes bacterium]
MLKIIFAKKFVIFRLAAVVANAVFVASLLFTAGPLEAPKPPSAERRPVFDEYWGIKVSDDYRWLENWNDPEVRAWSKAQNAAARASLAALPNRAAIRARIEMLMKGASVSYGSLVLRKGLLFALKHNPAKQQPQLVTLSGPDAPGSEKIILDPSQFDPDSRTSIDWFEPSPDGNLVAVSLSKNGTESGDVHLFEVASGKQVYEVIPRVNGGTAGGSLVWSPGCAGFFYTRYPRPGERPEADMNFYQQVYHHFLGTPTEKDNYCIGKDFPRIAEIQLDSAADGKVILAQVANGDGGEFAFHLLQPDGSWVQVAAFADQVVGAAFAPDAALYLLSQQGAPRGKVLRLAPGMTNLNAAMVVAAESDGVIQQVLPTASTIYLSELYGGPSRVRMVAPDGKALGVVPVAEASSVWRIVPFEGDSVLLNIESYMTPAAWYRWTPGAEKHVRTALFKISLADYSDCEVSREAAISKDGTRILLTVMRRKGIKLDGTNPTLLSGYGGFGIATRPSFSDSRRLWLDHGGVLAMTNLRGGSEFGETWHQAGMLTSKQNVFDDFIACARFLIAAGYASPKTLAIEGGSNGGLLMGAALTQAPELFRAVVTHVGIYDMLRNELTPNGTFNITEYGSVKNKAHFEALYAYSPYHRVQNGSKYPAVLFLTGANDARVDPMNSRKMVARLQAASASGRPVWLRTSDTTGHGGGTPLSERIEQVTDVQSFLFNQLGLIFKPDLSPVPK